MSRCSKELKTYWDDWDSLPDGATEESRRLVRDKMVDLLNRRSLHQEFSERCERSAGKLSNRVIG